MSIAFVIVTYNSEAVLPACLNSIPQGHDIVVVDNASRDRSAEVARCFGARVLVNEKNLGFGAACNRGAKLLATSHVFFLNPDAVLCANTAGEIEKAMVLYPDAGAFGPAITHGGKRQKFRSTSFVQNQGRRYAEETPPAVNAAVDFLDGAALVCDLKLFWELGGFDENIFLYFEDDDLCFRIKSQGGKLIYVPAAAVCHERNRSSGRSLRLDYFRSFHAMKSRVLVSGKHGLPIDIHAEKRRAAMLLFRSSVTLNVRKAAKSLGTLSALSSDRILSA